MVALHRDTSEWSAQGLGATAASLVEAAARSGVGTRVVVVEAKKEADGGAGEDVNEDEGMEEDGLGSMWDEVDLQQRNMERERQQESDLHLQTWKERMPMLSGSTRRIGLEGAHAGYGGRTIEVGTVLSRWFHFGRGDWLDI